MSSQKRDRRGIVLGDEQLGVDGVRPNLHAVGICGVCGLTARARGRYGASVSWTSKKLSREDCISYDSSVPSLGVEVSVVEGAGTMGNDFPAYHAPANLSEGGLLHLQTVTITVTIINKAHRQHVTIYFSLSSDRV